MTLRSYIIWTVFLCIATEGFSQAEDTNYQPLSDRPEHKNQIIKNMINRYERDIALLPKQNKKDIVEAYKTRNRTTIDKLENGHFIFDKRINGYFDRILKNVLETNPQISNPEDIRVFISRYDFPNASCLGEGTLVFNIGLIRRLENESQIAFIICHEIAHQVMDHVNTSIHNRVENVNSKTTKSTLKKIKKSEYRTATQAKEYLKGLVYEERRHSRMYEAEADSFAIELLKNTDYDLSEAIRTLELLDSIDQEKYTAPLKISERFDAPEYPFKNSWLEDDSGLNMNKVNEHRWDIDSLKTHPDCKKRIELLENIIPKNHKPGKKDIQKTPSFDELILIGDHEMIASNYHFGDYGNALYYCLKLLNEYPDNAYIRAMIGICFYEIYIAQKTHKLGRHVSLPSQKHNERYRELLLFIHHLRLQDIANISWYFLKKDSEKYQTDEHYIYALALAAKLMDFEPELKELKMQYLTKYPKGQYLSQVQELE